MSSNTNRGGRGGGGGGSRGGGSSSGGNRGGSSSGGGGGGRGGGGFSGGGQFHSSRPSSSSEASSSSRASSSSSGGGGRFGSRPPSSGRTEPTSQLSFGNRQAIEGVQIKTIKIEDLSNVGALEIQPSNHEKGTVVKAVVNYFPVKAPEGPFYMYDVKIQPEVDSKYLAGKLVKQVMPKDKIYLYDGLAILYTKNPLTINKEVYEKTLKEDKTVYKITISFTRSLSSKTIDATMLQFMNVILKRAQSNLDLQRIGRNYYNTNEKVVANIKEHNVKVLPGALSTTFLGSKGLMLNVDMIYKTLRTDTVYSILKGLQNKFKDNHERIANEFKNTIVLCSYNKRTIHVDDINFGMSPRSTFVKKTGEKITFAKYYEEQYDIKVKDMNQPLLVHTDRKDPKKVEYYLPELCMLTGLTDDMRKDHHLMKALKNATGLTPNQRIRQIVHSQQECLTNKKYVQQLEEWGLEINEKLLQVSPTVLQKESVNFGNKGKSIPGASWDVKKEKMYKPEKIEKWCVYYPSGSKADTNNFIKMMNDVANPIGMAFSNPVLVEISDIKDEIYEKEIDESLKKEKPQLALVVLFNDSKQRYSRVKQLLCNRAGIISQCVKLSTISSEKGLASKATKIIVQICSKLGGAPWTVPLAFPNKEPTMIIGMDVYHSGEIYKRTKASVAGFVASTDKDISSFFTKCIVQEAGKEIVDELESCVIASLNKFKQKNKIFPKHIIFFRDGVGEGQKEAVLAREVMACKKAIANVAPGCKLNYVVVSKRINTRIFAQADPKDPTNFTNPLPGTVLDYGVISQRDNTLKKEDEPEDIEFYLVAQQVDNAQGTATPTKYHTIWNESIPSKEYLETLSFRLCHSYYNWFGTIRVPSPCMYAHKIASLVGQYTKTSDFKENLNDKLFYL